MIPARLITTVIICWGSIVLPTEYLQAQISTISGVVNRYSKVTSVECNRVRVEQPDLFRAGDKILLIQMQGALVSTFLNEDFFGSVVSYRSAGDYEFHLVSSVIDDEVILKNVVERSYEISGQVQLIYVPQYDHAVVVGQLSGAKWDGSTGGVIAIECAGTLTLNAGISASGIGFRPGPSNRDPGPFIFCNPDILTNPLSSNKGGHKGEGIAVWQEEHALNKGPWANGGGGGNDHNAGGGGGSNAGVGGRGGFADPVPESTCLGNGMPGRAIKAVDNRAFLGGAGGNGHDNNLVSSTGGTGGGIIVIVADAVIGNKHPIEANGAVPDQATYDGTGGGGAGGTILLSTKSCSDCHLKANGGDGGNNNWASATLCYGPGGGGGGGAIRYNGDLSSSVVSYVGGAAGRIVNPGSICFDSNFGATDGQAGSSKADLVLYEAKEARDTTITFCKGQSYVLPDNQTVNDEGRYPVLFKNQSGCDSSVNYVVAFGNKLEVKAFATPEIILTGEEVLLSVLPDDTDQYVFQWTPADGVNTPNLPQSTAKPQEATWYYVAVADEANDCFGSDSVLVVVETKTDCGFYLPNAFTPDGNGINDCFKVLGNSILERFSLSIYNRWGELVYETNDHTACWDGSYKNQEVPVDVYIFYLSYRCPEKGDFSTKGVVSLIR
jgi:gliding motility-associated-like protein